MEEISSKEGSGVREGASVRGINNGNESVPTMVFPDGSSLTEPGYRELKRVLESKGMRLSPLSWLAANLAWVVVGVFVLLALMRIFSG
jgi:hypothetical protein